MGEGKSSLLIVVEAPALAAWIPVLAAALGTAWNADVKLRITDAPAADTALQSLLSLERMLLRGSRPCWTDRVERAALEPVLECDAAPPPGIVVDLTHEPAADWPRETLVLSPRYNGGFGETALASALFFDGTPLVEIVERRDGMEPRTVARGVASLEAAQGIGGAMEAVWSRVVPLIIKARQRSVQGALVPGKAVDHYRAISHMDIARHGAKSVARAAARAAYRLCCHAPHWRVGWRRVGPGGDVWSRGDLAGVRWNVLPDPGDHFYADPFPVRRAGRDYLFFEDLDHKTSKGVISVVPFDDHGVAVASIPVLEEPWHLSYPFMIEENGEIYMVPESSLSGEIAIYRAADFPHRWQKEAVLVSGVEAADATIIRHDGLYWMFAVVRDGIGGYSDTLAIWHAPALFGPWTAHAGNPLLIDDRAARPAGNMVLRDGQLWRPVQDCRAGYGAALGLARVTQLDTESYAQKVETVLRPDRHWPGRKLHTVNSSGHIEAIDGSVIRPKFGPLANMVEARTRPPSIVFA